LLSSIVRINEGLALIIASLVIALVFGSDALIVGDILTFILVALAAIIAVIPHELMHRWSARKMGCSSRYVLDPMGLLLTLITAIPFIPFKIIMPGFVLISCPLLDPAHYKRVEGVTSFSGPVTNILISVISLALIRPLIYIYPYLPLLRFLYFSYGLNAWVAFFNLLPIPPLDGSKIIRWRPIIWGSSIALSLGLFILWKLGVF
jgi:Zn-dependent protease